MISRQTAVILAQDELGDKNETRDSAGILAMNCKMLGDQVERILREGTRNVRGKKRRQTTLEIFRFIGQPLGYLKRAEATLTIHNRL
jgi:hypothetical protein